MTAYRFFGIQKCSW